MVIAAAVLLFAAAMLMFVYTKPAMCSGAVPNDTGVLYRSQKCFSCGEWKKERCFSCERDVDTRHPGPAVLGYVR